MEDESGREMWMHAALKEIAYSGVEGVRVEVLAARLGITKGGFYRRFKDRRALLDAMLETWARGRIASVQEHGVRGGGTPRGRGGAPGSGRVPIAPPPPSSPASTPPA